MFALLVLVLVVTLVVGLREEHDSVLDRLDPELWPYLHH
jgi:hypothetical protein